MIGYAKELGFDKTQTLSFMKYASERGDKLEFNTEPSVGGKIVGAVRGGLQGMTFGAGDEIVAGGAAAAKKMLQGDDRAIGDIYEQELQRERERIGQFREDEPTLAYGSEIVGGLAVPLGATKTFKGAFGTGAALGGVSAAAASEGDINDRLLAIPVGAAMGAILGGTFQVAGKTISDNLRDYMSKKAQQAASEGAQSVQRLKQEATAAYQEAYQQGVKISPDEFMNFLTDTIDKASGGGARGVSKSLTPKVLVF